MGDTVQPYIWGVPKEKKTKKHTLDEIHSRPLWGERLDIMDASIEWIMLHTPKPQKTVIDRKTFAMRLECQLGAAHGPGNDMIGKKQFLPFYNLECKIRFAWSYALSGLAFPHLKQSAKQYQLASVDGADSQPLSRRRIWMWFFEFLGLAQVSCFNVHSSSGNRIEIHSIIGLLWGRVWFGRWQSVHKYRHYRRQ